MAESWLPVVGRETYEVSDHGRVRNALRGNILKPQKAGSRGTHLVVQMGANQPKRYVHHLVLEAFVGPRPEGLMALHYDDDYMNNHVGNLYWGTLSQNTLDSVRNGNHVQARKTHCNRAGHELTPENVIVVNGKWRRCKKCESIRNLTRESV